MKVYKLRADSDHYQGLIMPDGNLYEFARRFNRVPIERSYANEKISVDPDTRSFPKGDYPSLIPNVPIFSHRALLALRDLLDANGDIFPVVIEGEEYYFFSVTRVINALDQLASEIVRFDDSSEILNIRSHSFFRKKLSGAIIFTVPQASDMDVFVTDAFVKRVHAAGLKGFWFPIIWSSD